MLKPQENFLTVPVLVPLSMTKYKSELLIEDQSDDDIKDGEEEYITITVARSQSFQPAEVDQNSMEVNQFKNYQTRPKSFQAREESDKEDEERTESMNSVKTIESLIDIKIHSGNISKKTSTLETVKSQKEGIKTSQLQSANQHRERCSH